MKGMKSIPHSLWLGLSGVGTSQGLMPLTPAVTDWQEQLGPWVLPSLVEAELSGLGLLYPWVRLAL